MLCFEHDEDLVLQLELSDFSDSVLGSSESNDPLSFMSETLFKIPKKKKNKKIKIFLNNNKKAQNKIELENDYTRKCLHS